MDSWHRGCKEYECDANHGGAPSRTKEDTTMTDQSRDRIEGNVDELTGRGKSAFGELTGDEQTQSEGQTDQATGKGKQALADVKDKVDDVVKKVTNG